MVQIIFTHHAQQQMKERGAAIKEVKETILSGEKVPAKHSRVAYRKNFQYNSRWGEKFYHIKQVLPIARKENKKIIVITVYTFYF